MLRKQPAQSGGLFSHHSLMYDVTKLKNGASQNLYSYNGTGTISAIQHNGFQYDFNYDVFEKLISTKIGNTALSSNTYSASGLLTRKTYAKLLS